MELLDIFKKRYAVRNFSYQAIPSDIWQQILEAGRIAATSRNKQARRFVTITDPTAIAELATKAKMQDFVKNTSALVVGCAPEESTSGIDVIISMTQMETMAVAQGLGTIWLGQFDRDALAEHINLPQGLKIVIMMGLGYPGEPGTHKEKLSITELYTEDCF